ncbi:glycoside hydrolase family 31 protein [Mucilaginibacter sp. RS28]|uniref:Glycoside hydrolase family 31 protein n=1 Tax=Mucilaginibacter straminoryzae TaxID=2932774 RepID=A0A9X1X5X5_9SPHI|nr:glycoside hydrolase family 31 protein [Mucilaginibacter straminoryzae]MCJ8211707.1 glycoside hydrolase family 31 protein [Mucilaginibacter straminoryzae]
MDFQLLGNTQSVTQQDQTLIIKTAEATARVSVYSPTIIRVCVTRTPDKEDTSFAVIQQSSGELNYLESDTEVIISTSALLLRISKSPLRFSFYTADGKELSRDDDRFGINWQGDRVINYRKLYPDEKFIGLGEKVGNLNRRGWAYTNWNTDCPDYGVKTDPLYKSFPFFIGIYQGGTYGLFLDNTNKSYFDFGATTDNEMSWFGADNGDINYYFFGEQSVAGIIRDYTWLTGRMEMPALWSLGYQQCRWSYMSAKEVLDIAAKFREKQIPADVMYCDIDYMQDYKIFTWNEQTFANPKALLEKLKEMNFKLVTIVDPGIKIEEGYQQYDEGVEKGYFATYPNGEKFVGEVWPGRCHFPDFFRQDVREWWGKSFSALTEPGVEGFWNDMNEPAAWGQNIPGMVKFGDKFMPEVRNAYGMQMARGTYEGTRALLNNKRPFVLTRAAYAGTQRYSAVWTGDNTATDDHLLLGQRLVNALGVTGMSFVGVDIGGFTGNPTPELMVRWNSLGVYTPMFRNHAMQGTVMREPWEWGEANEQIIKKDIEQRYKLLPYIYSSFYQSCKNGLPVSRTLAIDYTFDEQVYNEAFQNEFLFGDSILVAPVISTRHSAEVYLPEGQWYRLSSDELYNGGEAYTVDAPLDDLPVFVKSGTIIPMQHIVQSTQEQGDGVLELHIWKGNEATSFTYYEDDGETYDYENGAYYLRTISYDPANQTLTISEGEGSYTSRFTQLQVILHGFDGKTVQPSTLTPQQINITL